jgi:DNA-binding MarR family transcriptional regulator
MAIVLSHTQALALWQDVSLALVRGEGPDLSARQISILMIIYLELPPHTVRGLAARLDVTKPVITRALDSMGDLDLVARRRDDVDRRNVVIQRTATGALWLERLSDLIRERAKAL